MKIWYIRKSFEKTLEKYVERDARITPSTNEGIVMKMVRVRM